MILKLPKDFGRESSEVDIVYNLFDKPLFFFKRVGNWKFIRHLFPHPKSLLCTKSNILCEGSLLLCSLEF